MILHLRSFPRLVLGAAMMTVALTGCSNSEPTTQAAPVVETRKAPASGAIAAPEFVNAPKGVKTGDFTGGLLKKQAAAKGKL